MTVNSTTILIGDVRRRLRQLPDESVHCVVTSPPYFGLRDYGCAGQIGLEPTPDAYIDELVRIFREVRRVLWSQGTLWLNLGDSYSQQGKWGGETSGKHADAPPRDRREFGLAHKQRLMIPARVALALQADGWWLRDEIVWHKPNPMPVSVTDRTTPAHEMVYMFSRSARYRYDMQAVKEPIAESSRKRYAQPTIADQQCGAKQDAYESGFTGQRARSRRPNEILASLAKRARDNDATATAHGRTHSLSDYEARNAVNPGELRQPRSVWSIPTRPFKGAHFATFPPDLVRPCIKAGCVEGGTVLDPFFGAGTTGLVAAEIGRNCIGIELNPEYGRIAAERLGLHAMTPDADIYARRVA